MSTEAAALLSRRFSGEVLSFQITGLIEDPFSGQFIRRRWLMKPLLSDVQRSILYSGLDKGELSE